MNIHQCKCDKPEDARHAMGVASSTLVYSPMVFDGYGNRVGGNGNIVTTEWECRACGEKWVITT